MPRCKIAIAGRDTIVETWVRTIPRIGENIVFGAPPEKYRVVMITHHIQEGATALSGHPYQVDIAVEAPPIPMRYGWRSAHEEDKDGKVREFARRVKEEVLTHGQVGTLADSDHGTAAVTEREGELRKEVYRALDSGAPLDILARAILMTEEEMKELGSVLLEKSKRKKE